MQPNRADVIVTDGFTGNVALKSLESALRSLAGLVFHTLESTEEARAASAVVLPAAARRRRRLRPRPHRWRGAARREGRVRDLARLVVGARDRERGPGRA